MKTTICIVAKNEAEGIVTVIRSVKKYADEVIVVDGRSTDGTYARAKGENVTVVQDHGAGRGDGVRVGLTKATGEIVVLFDADGSHNPQDIPRLIAPIAKNSADLVIASRRTGGTLDTNPGFAGVIRSLGVDFMAYLVNLRFGTQFTDILYSFRAIKRSAADRLGLRASDFSIEQEMLVRAIKMNLRVKEIPSREYARGWGISKLKTHTGLVLLIKLMGLLI